MTVVSYHPHPITDLRGAVILSVGPYLPVVVEKDGVLFEIRSEYSRSGGIEHNAYRVPERDYKRYGKRNI